MKRNISDAVKVRNVLDEIARLVRKEAKALGFTDISSVVAETFNSEYIINIIFSYRGKSHRVFGSVSSVALMLLKGDELEWVIEQRAKDLLRHMYRVSGKNKEIPQTEEEYEQKISINL
jgi:hypothetical protein